MSDVKSRVSVDEYDTVNTVVSSAECGARFFEFQSCFATCWLCDIERGTASSSVKGRKYCLCHRIVVRIETVYIVPKLKKAGSTEAPGKLLLLLLDWDCCCSVTKLCLTLCDPQGPQHTRLPCPSPTPGVCSNSCPLSQWCHPTISSSAISFPSCP